MEAAVAAAAAQLGLREDQVDIEILKDPVPSTFGKVGEPAVVRVTAREPAQGLSSSSASSPPAPVQANPVSESTAGEPDKDAVVSRPARGGHRHPEVSDPEAIAADTELAGDFVEGLLDVLDVDGDITTWVDGAGGHVDVEGPKLGFLIGHDGEVLSALQELTRLAVLRQSQRWTRIAVDVNGFRARRREEIAATARGVAERVAAAGDDEELEPMTAFERKIVHDAVATISGVESESIGEEPNRRVVIRRATS